MAGVINPGQRRGLMDQVAQGLQIASQVYGIKSAMEESDYRDEQRAEAKELANNKKLGIKTPGEVQEIALTRNLVPAKEGEEGAIQFAQTDGQTTSWKTALKPPKEADPIATARLKLDQDKFAYEKERDKSKPALLAGGEAAPNGTKEFKKLPQENQIQVKELATTMGKQSSIKNLLASMLDEYRNAESDDQKVAVGGRMLKVINSPLGSDAIGAEEAKRLGSFLEKKFFNLTQPGSVFGRDLGEFETQVANQVESLGSAIALNQGMIDKLSGREVSEAVAKETRMPKGDGATAYADEGPKPGHVEGGYRFKGGNPADKSNWEKVK